MRAVTDHLNKQKAIRVCVLLAADIVLINLAAFLALFVRFEFDYAALVESGFLKSLWSYAAINTLTTVVVFAVFKLYNSLWEFASTVELIRLGVASVLSAVLCMFGMYMLRLSVPRSFPILYALFLGLFCALLRFAYRTLRRRRAGLHSSGGKRTMLIGGGQAGAMVMREFLYSAHSENKVVCIIDDDKSKRGSYLRGVRIVGGVMDIPTVVCKYNVEEIVLAIPSASRKQRQRILEICQQTGCRLRTLPGLYQIANGEVNIQQIREVDIEDLLGRDTVQVDLNEVAGYIEGKVVLVTGGGGSIGSELCRRRR